ncbi:hypothetical protein RS030_120 [Cryptosporidium xiaoi]|uniref:Acyltransferase n=1 Tax=Cryptosporidium xiaoi TaxID=659607 RepID=A0AAV9Y1J9_9CRYT
MKNVKSKENKEEVKLGGNIKIVDIPFKIDGKFAYNEYIGCVAYTILISIWALSIFIPIALSYWFYVGNWLLFYLFLLIILIPIFFRINDNIPLFLKKLCNFITKDIHFWTGPARIIIEEPDLDVNDKQLLCIHPHGILGIGSMYLTISGIINKCFYLIVTESLVWFQPIINIVLNSAVKLRGASHTSFKNTMIKGEGPLLMFPGGFHETILLSWGVDHIYAKKRFGFIKYCLKYNYSIRPVYVFGECLSFHQLQYFKKFRWFLNDFSLPSVLFCGETWWNPLLPVKNVPYLIVIGRPIVCCHETNFIDNQSNDQYPSRELIREYQSLYIENLKRIYKEYSQYYVEFYRDNPNIQRYLKCKLAELKID